MPRKTLTVSKPRTTNILDFEFRYDYVLVKAIDRESVNGLVDPEQYDDKPELGVVVKVGPGRILEDGTLVETSMKPGDTVFFGKYSTAQVRFEGVDYHVIRDDDCMAVFRHEKH